MSAFDSSLRPRQVLEPVLERGAAAYPDIARDYPGNQGSAVVEIEIKTWRVWPSRPEQGEGDMDIIVSPEVCDRCRGRASMNGR